jgi:hypothetical protein
LRWPQRQHQQVFERAVLPLAWLQTRTKRDQRIIDRLLLGERTGIVARAFRLSPGRIAQLRRVFAKDWQRFGESPEPEQGADERV